MDFCRKCVMPDTKPGVVLDNDGFCNACRTQILKRQIDWVERRHELSSICDEVRRESTGAYDCIVPVSGGKDGFYQAYTMRQMGMRVLCVILSPHLPTTEGIHNLNNLVEKLDVDLIKMTLKPSVFRTLRREAFLRQGEPNWPEHNSIFSTVANIAKVYEVPLVIWGEDIAVEFGGQQNKDAKADATDIGQNDLIKSKTIDDFLGNDIGPSDVSLFYRYPSIEMLRELGLKSLYLGYYHFWDGYKHFRIAQEHGFKRRAQGPLSGNCLDYDNIDEKLCEINIWLKYIKFGFWRPTDQCCYQIWGGYMDRDEAIRIVNRLQGEFPKEYLEDFLRFHDLTAEEFWKTVDRFRNPELWEQRNGTWHLRYKVS